MSPWHFAPPYSSRTGTRSAYRSSFPWTAPVVAQLPVTDHVNELPPAPESEFNHSVSSGEQSVVATPAYIGSRVELGAPLANEDATRTNSTAVIDLHS